MLAVMAGTLGARSSREHPARMRSRGRIGRNAAGTAVIGRSSFHTV